jgi:hypothetical protein
MKKSFIITSMAALAALCFSLTAQAEGPVVVSDKDDYAPGETAMFSAAGFQPGEMLDFSVAVSDENGLWVPDIAWADVPADASGNAEVDYVVPETWLNKSLQLTVMGLSSSLMATTTFTDSGVFSYNPTSLISLTATAGGGVVGFPGAVTAPAGNGSFGGILQLGPVPGFTPIPMGWVAAVPNPMAFSTGVCPFACGPDTKSRIVSFAVPVGAPPGEYRANILEIPLGASVGVGPGTQVKLTVIGSSHAPVISCSGAPANLGSAVGCLGAGNSFSHNFPVTYTQSGTNPVLVTANFTLADSTTVIHVPVATVTDQDVGDTITVGLTGGTNPVTISGPGSGTAPFTVHIQAFDNHGLGAVPHDCGGTASANITYAFNGFFSPLHAYPDDSTATKVKRGSAVPVKFQISDCSGTPITPDNLPGGTMPTINVTLASGAVADGLDIDDAGSSAGDPGDTFRWDSTDMQWIFNLKTNSSYNAGTYWIWANLYGTFSTTLDPNTAICIKP